CGFRDHHLDLQAAGARRVFGLSSQDTSYQREAVERLHLPFELLSDATFTWADELRLPDLIAGGQRFHRRLTLILDHGTIGHVFYPVFPPSTHADVVVKWLEDHRPVGAR
ncbi:MAG: peroxiredoxin, partial [Actinomycetes bacterium]